MYIADIIYSCLFKKKKFCSQLTKLNSWPWLTVWKTLLRDTNSIRTTLCIIMISMLWQRKVIKLSWNVFQILEKLFLTPSQYKAYKLQKWLQYFLVSDSGPQANCCPSLHEKARQAHIPHPVMEPERCLVIDSDGVIWSIPELGVLIIQGEEVVTQRRDTWGKVKNISKNWRRIHLAISFQCTTYAKIGSSLIQKESRSHSYPLRASKTSNHVQSSSFNHNN